VRSRTDGALAAATDGPVGPDTARHLAHRAPLDGLCAASRARRDRVFGRVVTYSPKVFLPVTNLCRNACDYCSFRKVPTSSDAWTMSPGEVDASCARAAEHGAIEALLCLGDEPEAVFSGYRAQLAGWGHDSTVDYLERVARIALRHGLLPHTNAGVLSAAALARLKPLNASMGLMLESASDRLCEPGGPHARAPDKRPARRLEMHRAAGAARIAFTSGLLIGIGETLDERVDTLLAIRAVHEAHGHVQEVIVQRFRARPGVRMAGAPDPADDELSRAIALARLVLPDDVSVQAPPNLGHGDAANLALLAAGVDDLGGISPVTPDYINPAHPWPHLDALGELLAGAGYALRPRLPIHDRFAARPGFLADQLLAPVAAARRRLGGERRAAR
jgi:FO synthase